MSIKALTHKIITMCHAVTYELTVAPVMYDYETTGLWAQTCQSSLHLVLHHTADEPELSGAAEFQSLIHTGDDERQVDVQITQRSLCTLHLKLQTFYEISVTA